MAARAGFEPTTLRTKGDESTNKPPRPTNYYDDDAVISGNDDSNDGDLLQIGVVDPNLQNAA